MRRLLLAAIVCSLGLLPACGGDDEPTEASFCEDLEAFAAEAEAAEATEEDSGGDDGDPPTEEEVAAFRELADAAPEEIAEDFDVVAGVIEQLAEIDEDADPEAAFGAVFALLLNPVVAEAFEAVGTYATDTCGLEDFDDELGGLDGTGGDDAGFDLDDGADAGFDDGGFDDDDGIATLGVPEAEVDAVVERALGEEPAGRSRFSSGSSSSLDLGTTLDAEAARLACDEIAEALAGHPDAAGTASLSLHEVEDTEVILATNDDVAPGDPGTCRTP
jgi:hypothetical protein